MPNAIGHRRGARQTYRPGAGLVKEPPNLIQQEHSKWRFKSATVFPR